MFRVISHTLTMIVSFIIFSVALATPPLHGREKKKSIDYNSVAAVALQKNSLQDAAKSIALAIQKNPKNPMTWVNHARLVVARNIQAEPVDYCDYPNNWIFEALSDLSKAWDLNHAKTSAAVASLKDSDFAKFSKRIEFKNWSIILRLPFKSDVVTDNFFSTNNDWLIRKNPMPATVVTFAPTHELVINAADGAREVGTWVAESDRVITKTMVKTKNGSTEVVRTFDLTTDNHGYLPNGNIKLVVLKDRAGLGRWLMGPEIADCPQQ